MTLKIMMVIIKYKKAIFVNIIQCNLRTASYNSRTFHVLSRALIF